MLLRQEDSLLLLIDVQERLTPHVVAHEAFIERCTWLLRLAKKMAVPVLVSEQYPRGLGATIQECAPYFDPKTECVAKLHFSCMQEPAYVVSLNQHHKKQVILIGIEAHVCILHTAMELQEAGLEVYVVVDAVSSRHAQDLKYGLKRMKQAGIHLITSEMVFFEWLRRAGTPEFKELSKEFLM